MRVITGSARGVRLLTPEGENTRPTADRVKEALFSVIQFEIEGRRVLDLFAGTGQLGIEALSRGAARATFVDERADAIRLIRTNLARTKLSADAEVYRTDAMAFLAQCRSRYDLIFLDPPYAGGLLENSLKQLGTIDIVAEGGIIVCERAAEKPLAIDLPQFTRSRDYRYGKTLLTFFRRSAG